MLRPRHVLLFTFTIAWLGLIPISRAPAIAPSSAPPGSLDPSFGLDGKVITPIGSGLFDGVGEMAIQPDGKILAAGWTYNGADYDFALARYDATGVLDPSFDGDGIVTTPIDSRRQQAHGVAVMPDGRIVMAGGDDPGPAWLIRYKSDGSLDTSFDGDGIASRDMSMHALAVQGDGKLVVAGQSAGDLAVARFGSDGAPDTSFDGDGLATVSFTSQSDAASSVLIQPDGKILAGGNAGLGNDSDFALARWNSDGSPDLTFDGDGKVTTPVISTGDAIYDIALQPNGYIVASGAAFTQAAFARYQPNGTLDPGFSGDGITTVTWGDPPSSAVAEAVAIVPGGQIVAGGSAAPMGRPDQFAVARMNSDGSADETFGDQGLVMTHIQSDRDRAFAMTIQSDGKYVLGGQTCVGNCDFGLARYLPEEVEGSGLPSDFNGDGLADLAVGVPWEDIGSVTDTGALSVLFATDQGLASRGNEFWDQSGAGSAFNQDFDGFGYAATSGDFNGDGFADLASGTPGKVVGSAPNAGAVTVIYGSPIGLVPTGSQLWTQDSTDIEETAEMDDFFGWSVAAGDFNGDGFEDLAVGVPGERVAGRKSAGAVNVLYGSSSGLVAAADQVWSQNSVGIADKAEGGDQFGFAVATGDFDGEGHADLAIGAPRENLGTRADTGQVHVLYGSGPGLTSTGSDLWHQDSVNINDKAEAGDLFGYQVVSGDFNAGTFDDLLTAIPGEDLPKKLNAGAISVIFGRSSGLGAGSDQFWHQDSIGINDVAERDDEFSLAITAGDFDGDGFDDAAVGIPGENLGTMRDPGAVSVIYGTTKGLAAAGDQFWHQNIAGIADKAERDDLFGYSLTAANFGNGPQEDLAIGVVLEKVNGVGFAGAVNLIYGGAPGLRSAGNQFWHQDSSGVIDAVEFDDEFGFGLAQRGAGTSDLESDVPLARRLVGLRH